MAKPIMIMGCTSDAGKSLLVSVLCRHLANRGLRVAPFKAQNMSNNAAVTEGGGEIGRAQYLQAIAARVPPHTDFNPVLLKPQGNVLSQIVVEGQVHGPLHSMDWHQRRDYLWPVVQRCLQRVQQQYQQVVIEGAGSPAEVNLRKSDIVNMEVALACQADVYLVVDIDRGGAYAHLLGTYLCLSDIERALVKGFILNKFRGDASLLSDANQWIEQQTGVPVVAVIPFTPHQLPEEDNFFHRAHSAPSSPQVIRIGLVCYPFASNLDEFDPLAYCEGVQLVPVRSCADLQQLDALILPGSKQIQLSYDFLQKTGLDQAIRAWATQQKPLWGICGGLQLLGEEILDPLQQEGGSFHGLGLLPLQTTFQSKKHTQQRQIHWQQHVLTCYEIHQGYSEPLIPLATFIEEGTGWQHGHIFASYLHGLFENRLFLQWFLQQLGWQGHIEHDWYTFIDTELDRLAEQLHPHLSQLTP